MLIHKEKFFTNDDTFSMDKLTLPLTIREDWKASSRVFLVKDWITNIIY